MLDKQSLLLRKASITTVLGIVATVVWMMVANVGLRGGENAAVDSAAGMISQAVAVALFTMPLVVFAIVHLYVSEEQENGIWGVIRARNGKIGHLLAFRLSSALLFLVVWALGYVGTLGALVAFHYSAADAFDVIPMFFWFVDFRNQHRIHHRQRALEIRRIGSCCYCCSRIICGWCFSHR